MLLLFKCIGVRCGLGSETKNALAIERFGCLSQCCGQFRSCGNSNVLFQVFPCHFKCELLQLNGDTKNLNPERFELSTTMS